MATAVRKFVLPTVIGHVLALVLVVQAAFAVALPAYLLINAETGYTTAYTYESLFDDEGVMIPVADR